MNLLIGIWLGIVIAGFMLDRGIQFIRDHSLFPSFSSSFAPISSDETWTHLESHGDVELMYRTIFPTLGLHAHRAVVVSDLPIESLLHVFRDTPNHVRIFAFCVTIAYDFLIYLLDKPLPAFRYTFSSIYRSNGRKT